MTDATQLADQERQGLEEVGTLEDACDKQIRLTAPILQRPQLVIKEFSATSKMKYTPFQLNPLRTYLGHVKGPPGSILFYIM